MALTYEQALANLQKGGLTGQDLTDAISSLKGAYTTSQTQTTAQPGAVSYQTLTAPKQEPYVIPQTPASTDASTSLATTTNTVLAAQPPQTAQTTQTTQPVEENSAKSFSQKMLDLIKLQGTKADKTEQNQNQGQYKKQQ